MWRPCEREFNWRYFLGIYLILISFSCFFYRSCVSTSDPAPPPTRSKIQVAVPLQLNQRLITLEGCNKNDLVFVVWNIRHGQFVVVQDSHTLYFVHADSLPGLNLTPPPPAPLLSEASNELALTSNQIPVPYYGIGRVIDKEYCQARKVSQSDISKLDCISTSLLSFAGREPLSRRQGLQVLPHQIGSDTITHFCASRTH